MSSGSTRIGVLSDTHLDYAARCRTHTASGLNMRVRDGMLALRETVTQMIEADVDVVLHGGDLFHRSHPSVGAIVWARQQLDRLAQAGIAVVGNTGNHDASAERGKSPATAAVHDPGRGVDFVTEPYRLVEPVDGVAIHMLSHYGLARTERLLPEPVDGAVNILSSHGAAMVPGHEVFRCVDSPGEQPIGLDLLLDDRFVVKALGHYHGMDEIMPTVWYAGSAIRRGFSDPAGGRGWLLMTVHTDGRVDVEPRHISQRAQHDLPAIDATGLSGADVEERIRGNLADVDLGDAIVRQVVTNCSTSIRRGIDQPALGALAADTLMWMPDFRRPTLDVATPTTVEGISASLLTAGSADLPSMFGGWVGEWAAAAGLAPGAVATVQADGDRHLRAASETAESADFQAPASPSTPAVPHPRTGASAPPINAAPEGAAATSPAAAPTTDAETGQESPW